MTKKLKEIEHEVTHAHAFFKSSCIGTLATAGPDVPCPRGFSLIFIALSVCFLSVATVSAVHRVGDGAEAALLMKEIQNNLENPMNLLV